MIYKTAYDTTLGQAFHRYSIEQSLKKALIQNGPSYFGFEGYNVISSVNFLPAQLTALNAKYSEIEYFAHPFSIEGLKDRNYLVLDSRLFVKENHSAGSNGLQITNKSEYDFSLKRYFMNFAWLNMPVNSFKNSLQFAGTIFSNWLSEIIARRFSLDPRDQVILSIITSFYYQQLFIEKVTLDEDTKQKLASVTLKATNAPSSLVFEIADQITSMECVADYCENVKKILDNIRLKDFNAGILYTIVGMNWYGLNNKENMAVALEHVPTWVAICYTAITNKTYKNTTIANVALKYSKKGAGDEFTKNFSQMVEDFLQPQGPHSHLLSLEDQIAELEQVKF